MMAMLMMMMFALSRWSPTVDCNLSASALHPDLMVKLSLVIYSKNKLIMNVNIFMNIKTEGLQMPACINDHRDQ